MSSQDWSTLTLNISGLYFSAAAGCKGSCFICRVWHVCFHANSHKHHGGCQKCLGGEGWGGDWAQNSLRSSLKVTLLNPCKQKICQSWMDVKKHKQQQQQQQNAVARNTSHISALWTVICKLIGTFVGFLLSMFAVLEPRIKNPFSEPFLVLVVLPQKFVWTCVQVLPHS